MTRITDEAVWVASRAYNESVRTHPSHPDAIAAALAAAQPYLDGVEEFEAALWEIRGLSDQPHREHGFDAGCPICKGSPREIASALSFVLASSAHLTDDGAAATPPADTGVRSAPAAESATPVGAGAVAPSSPHQVTALLASTVFHCFDHEEFGLSAKHATAVSDALVAAGFFGEGATPATSHRPTCGTTYGESCDGYCPAPAIDREALTELLRFNRHAPYVSNERLADMVTALIEGAS